MKKIMLLVLVGIFLISLVGATEKSLGTFKQNELGKCISLIQTDGNCTYNNISTVVRTGEAPKTFTLNIAMTKDDTFYNYSFCNISEIGIYNVHGFGDPNGAKTSWAYTFEITPSGFRNLLGFFVIIIVIAYSIGFIGFFGKSEWVSVIGGLSMMALGVYTVINGIDIYRSFITLAFSYFTIALGGIFTIVPLLGMIQENY